MMMPWRAACRVLDAGWEGLRGLEGRAAATAASLLGAQWPTQRWPIHVFTGGAITCMLTSSVCHLLGCCSFHISQVGGARLPCAAGQPHSGCHAQRRVVLAITQVMEDLTCWASTRVPLQMDLQECKEWQRRITRMRSCCSFCCQKWGGWPDDKEGALTVERGRAQLVWRFDYAGIVVLIVTSFFPPVYYGFLCEPLLRNFYLLSTLLLGEPRPV